MFSNTSLPEFIDEIINNYANVHDILDDCKTQSEKGFIFERLWDLIFKFGFHPNFLNNDYDHLLGNANNGTLKIMSSLKNYIKNNKVISGNSGGYSDITLQNKNTKEYIFITCKYPKSDKDTENSKSVKYYDIDNLISMRDHNKEIYKKFDIITLVPNKTNVLKKVKSSNKSSECVTKYLTEDKIFDEDNLEKCYQKLKIQLKKIKINDYDEIFLNNKEFLSFPFHQRLIEKKTSELIAGGNKTILWGCKPRSGKTYMTGNLILKQEELYPKYNVLIITPAPTETSPQFTDDLFKRYTDFKNFNILHIKSSKDLKNLKLEDKNIIVVSKQLLQSYINEKTIKEIKNLKLKLIVFDENHFGGTSDLSEQIITSYTSINTVKLFLTATYNKSLHKWKIPNDCQIFWDIEDERFCKTQNIKDLIEKHGENVKIVLDEMEKEGYSNEEVLLEYEKYPELHVLTTMFDSQRYDIIKDAIMDSKYGFSMDTLFALTKGKKREFQYPNQIKSVLEYISGNNKEKNFKNGDLSIFGRINKLVQQKNSRSPFTQLWFLPVNGINDISENLKKIMLDDNRLKKYDIYIVNSKSDDIVDNIKEEINKREIIAKENNKNGLIILAGNMLTLGITLQLCDVVFLLNDTLSSDKVMQMMYRSMTESKNKDKKCGFVIDMKISRVLHACLSYNIHKKIQNTEEKIKYLIEHHLINIDADYLINKKLDSDKIITKMLDIWKSDPVNNLNILLKQLEDDIIEMDNDDQKALNNYFTKSTNKNNEKLEFKNEEEDNQYIKNGKEIIKKESSDSSDSDSEDNDSDEDNNQKYISFATDILPFVIPFACMLTLTDNNNDFIEMLNTIGKNKELLEIFDEQSYIWWNNKGILNFIKKITSKYVEKNSNTFNIGIIMKSTLKSLIDKPTELLEFISERLKPKDIEKKKFGEVFTPMNIVFEMIDKLDVYYKKNNNEKSIFSNKDFKWFDSCVGMGNFMIGVYLRLMEGLKTVIKDEQKRKKHILENMLYMSELNKKNILICKKIFDINNEYNLNLYNGNTLELDIKKVWNITNFNVIVGNPPYNEELKDSGAKPLYNKFIEKYIDNCDYITFIVPSRWFAGGKGLDKFREKMLNRTDIVYIVHFDNASKIFGNSVEIKGGVNYFLKHTTYNGKCDFNNSMTPLNKFDVFVDGKYHNIIDKITQFKNITKLYHGQGHFNVKTNDERLNDDETLIKCYVSKQKGFIKYINEKYIKNDTDKYKVITARASTANYDCFGNMFIGLPNEICNQSYIFFEVNNMNEANSLMSYLKCRLPNFFLKLRKNSQDIQERALKWIPLPPLNKEWNDNEIYKYFNLTDTEIKLIKDTNIIGYKDINIQKENLSGSKNNETKPKKKVNKKLDLIESDSSSSDSEEEIEKPAKKTVKKLISKSSTKKSSNKKDSSSDDTDSEEEIEKPVKKLISKAPIKKSKK
jgi:site-specific DNA-methyltransferase (adenine-specific)